jgi:hypothetical protein
MVARAGSGRGLQSTLIRLRSDAVLRQLNVRHLSGGRISTGSSGTRFGPPSFFRLPGGYAPEYGCHLTYVLPTFVFCKL